jgi:agmatine/peptidylarginine deiminase
MDRASNQLGGGHEKKNDGHFEHNIICDTTTAKKSSNDNIATGTAATTTTTTTTTTTSTTIGDADSNCCLTRSEIYALVRETIMKRKHDWCVDGVCDHLLDSNFDKQMKYIRDNLKKARIFTGDSGRCKRLFLHTQRLQNIFDKNNSLEEEYNKCVAKYGTFHDRNAQHVRE